MDNPYTPSKQDPHELAPIKLSEPAIAKAIYVIDSNYVINRYKCERRLRIDHQLRFYIRVIGVIVLSYFAIKQAVAGDEWFWVVTPSVVIFYLLFGPWIGQRFRVFISQAQGLINSQVTCEFFSEGILLTEKEQTQFVPTAELKKAALFKEGLLLATKTDFIVFIPKSSVDNESQLVEFLRTVVSFDERYDKI